MYFSKALSMLFLISASLSAADPFVGTWKLNVEKSDFRVTATVSGGSATYHATGNGYVYGPTSCSRMERLHTYMVQFNLTGRSMKYALEGGPSQPYPNGLMTRA